MGYSIGIRSASPRLRKAMLDFMGREYRSWPALNGKPDDDAYVGTPSGDLDYDSRSKSVIGMDYGVCSDWEREYAFAVVRWMALKVGTRRRAFSDGLKTKEPTPFMVYDGYETWPIVVCTDAFADTMPVKTRWCAVDKLGIHNGKYGIGKLVQYVMYGPGIPKAAHGRAMKKVGPYPENGDRHAWRERFNQALLEEPKVRAAVEEQLGKIMAELRRLDGLWSAVSSGERTRPRPRRMAKRNSSRGPGRR